MTRILALLLTLALPALAVQTTVTEGGCAATVVLSCGAAPPPVEPPPPVRPPPATGCTTRATFTQGYTSGSAPLGPLSAGQTLAVAIPVTAQMRGRTVRASVVETVSTESGADVQFSMSACPGDFSRTGGGCMMHTQYTGGSVIFSLGPKPAGTPWYTAVCELPAGATTAYLNVRHVLRGNPALPSCSGSCGVFVQVN